MHNEGSTAVGPGGVFLINDPNRNHLCLMNPRMASTSGDDVPITGPALMQVML
jgi:hypothetical protein